MPLEGLCISDELDVMRRNPPGFLPGNQLSPYQLGKNPGVFGIAFHKPLGLAAHAMQPFDSRPLHPDGRAFFLAGKKINCRPHAQRQFGPNLLAMLVNPKFLFGSSDSGSLIHVRRQLTASCIRKALICIPNRSRFSIMS